MDPLLMAGAWAAAVMAIVGAGGLGWRAFVKAVRAVIREELARVWKDQDDIEARLSALELALQFVRGQLDRVERMMLAHVGEPDEAA
jgi:hypothetical protein